MRPLHVHLKGLHRVLHERVGGPFAALVQLHPLHVEGVHVGSGRLVVLAGLGSLPVDLAVEEILPRPQRAGAQVCEVGAGPAHRGLDGFGRRRLGEDAYW